MQRLLVTLVLAVYVLLAALYAVRTPMWQAPDEPAHFNYVRAVAETGTLPILQPGDYDQEYLEKIKSSKFPAGMSVDGIRYESWQPPLYYVAAVPFYLASRAGGIAAQVLALRLLSVLLGAMVLLVAFTIVREIFPDDHLLPLATAGAMATLPMHLAVTASISNDTAAELLIALMLWLAIVRLENRVTSRRFVILGGLLFGAGLLTKSTTYVPGASVLVAAEIGRWMLIRGADLTPLRGKGESSSRLLPFLLGKGSSEKGKGTASPVSFTIKSLTASDSSSLDSTEPDSGLVTPSAPRPPTTKGNGGKGQEATAEASVSLVSVLVSPGKQGGHSAIAGGAWRSPVLHLGALFTIGFVLSSPMFIRNMLTYGVTDPLVAARHESVVLGQPTTAEMIAQLGANRAVRDFATTTFRSFWAQFGWMGVLVDERIYLALLALTALALLGLALYTWRVIREGAALYAIQRWCLGVLALLLAAAIVDYVGYNGKFWQPQGRYLFPALVPLALFCVLGLREILAPPYARLLFALLYLMMVGLDIAALFLYIVPQLGA